MENGKVRFEDHDHLLKDEKAAVGTYQAVERMDLDEDTAVELRRIEHEHEEALELLKEQVLDGGVMEDDPEMWEAWVSAVEATAKQMGDEESILVLKESEQHGLRDYERTLLDETINFEFRDLIATKLLPRAKEHISTLDNLLKKS